MEFSCEAAAESRKISDRLAKEAVCSLVTELKRLVRFSTVGCPRPWFFHLHFCVDQIFAHDSNGFADVSPAPKNLSTQAGTYRPKKKQLAGTDEPLPIEASEAARAGR